MTTQRKTIKAGKHERIRVLLTNMKAVQPEPVVKDQQWLAERPELFRRPDWESFRKRL